jgi:hypothetical protein
MRRVGIVLVSVLAALAPVATARAGDGGGAIKVGWYSQQVRPQRAVIGARVTHTAIHADVAQPASVAVEIHGTRSRPSSTPVRYPVLPKTAPILQNPQPVGPGSFWYTDGAGHACMYAPSSILPCFTVVGTAAQPAVASPAVIAASVARRLPLEAGQIHASPQLRGLTGAESWFWLDPAPRPVDLSVSLAGETVRVSADPDVEWKFGDGASLTGGPGVPYEASAAPPDAIRRVYQTRCLPGDQGHDPYVLASCGESGYTVHAVVVWRISYTASGPVSGSGTLPTRTTESSTSYPVSESRAFLVQGGSQ